MTLGLHVALLEAWVDRLCVVGGSWELGSPVVLVVGMPLGLHMEMFEKVDGLWLADGLWFLVDDLWLVIGLWVVDGSWELGMLVLAVVDMPVDQIEMA